MGEKFSVAYRIFDAQYWGVAQRRRRVFLVADFDGECAGKILFEPKSVCGNFAESFGKKENTAAEIENSVGKSGEKFFVLNDQGGIRMDITENKTATLRAEAHHPPCVFENHGQDSRFKKLEKVSQTISSTFGTGGNNQPLVVDIRLTSDGTKNSRSNIYETKISRCLDTSGNVPQSNQGGVAICGTLNARDYKGVGNQYVAEGKLQVEKNSVRRLTPTECAKLQGFPADWCANLETENPTDEEIIFWQKVFQNVGKNKTSSQIRRWLRNPHSDSAEYKMWGNGIALPCAEFILKKISVM